VTVRILSILGTRPEAIKMVPVIRAVTSRKFFHHTLAVTAQHRELMDQVLGLFSIEPDFDLDIMEEGQELDEIMTRTLARLGGIIRKLRPDCILVQGDTTTALTGALAGFYNRVPVGHVEAGLRTSDRFLPYPEEVNRRLTDQLSSFHFCPTEGARQNLLAEDLPDENILVTGNTVVDAVNLVAEMPAALPAEVEEFCNNLREYLLVTGHRRENRGEPLARISSALASFAREHSEVGLLIALHPNPILRKRLAPALGGLANVLMSPAPGYREFVHLMKDAAFIVTDSGGIQEEACALAKFALVLRPETERPEAVEAGFARVIGTDTERVESEVSLTLEQVRARHLPPPTADNPFGDGRAAQRITEFLARRLHAVGSE